ncbi:TonB-dependent receptor [Marinimicrobium sp. C6131]|uniref:TonB-dependent receptor n=1 Tax=Marinimicrobium sp. C6131 TaxID=3022676 RepID=UPI00223CA854|nr:TonB-dependent receptor [Marinimicrobium sp. C6131]UZJ43985.1 TonB-dependent receptor [Marinimicrobium sp. C6131]
MNKNFVALLSPMLFWVPSAQAESPALGAASHFNIPKQRADVALTEFARQSNMTVIVPYDQVVGIETPELKGRYPLVDAAIHLLEGTGLKLSFSNNGQLFIRTEDDVKGNHSMLQKNKLSSAVVLAMSSLAGAQAIAQDSAGGALEEVLVTGVRASLERAMDVKRDSSGVVDAISAEDMGKFPDSNLAESLQRITGVSIDRQNGEGARVTVRGFGASFNMVTLNGRQMPAADAYGTTQGTTRAFNFANLASESVSAIEVYKTGKANLTTGGIGATIDIKTARPLDNPGLSASLGGKLVHDTTNRIGDDATPELSGLVSWTDSSDTFGAAVSGSFQKRHSGAMTANVADWRIFEWIPQGNPGAMELTPGSELVNEPAPGQLYGLPNNLAYQFSDRKRERINAQITLQYQPSNDISFTTDYTFAENKLRDWQGSQSVWFTRISNGVEFDTDQPVATPVFISEDIVNTKPAPSTQMYNDQTNTLKSFGFNTNWQATDSLELTLDAHDSTMESLPSGPEGLGRVQFLFGAPVVSSHSAMYNSTLPTFQFEIDDSLGNNNGVLDKSDMGSQISEVFYSSQVTDTTQIKLDGSLEFDNGEFNIGIESGSNVMGQKWSQNYMVLGDFGVANPGELPEDLFSPYCISCQFEDFDTSNASNSGWRGDALALSQWGAKHYGHDFGINPSFSDNHEVDEQTDAFYFQFSLQEDLGEMPYNILAGVRYESTDVKSTSFMLLPSQIRWTDNNDFRVDRESSITPFSKSTSYEHLLPSFDFDIEIVNNLIARFSYSKTIARPNYDALRSAVNIGNPSGPTLTGIQATASASNPELVPLESDNLDLSAEWYFDDSSYVSLGFYEKRVTNFIGNEQISQPHFGLRDATAGPRAQRAAEELAARDDHDGFINETELFVMTAVLDNPQDFPNGADDYDPSGEFAAQIATEYDIVPNESDPEYEFLTSIPVNNKEAKIYGFEWAVQHFFGDSGFGIQANYTMVKGDIGFDDTGSTSASQFALVGLSDTANLALMYENYGLSARLTYNWRDEFLSNTNRGSYRSPEYTEEYSQVDLNVSYDLTDNLSLSFEGLNLTEENIRMHGRSVRQMWFLEELGARYQLGARYTF